MSAVKMSRPSEDITGALNLPQGPHMVTVSLLTADGKIKEKKTANVSVDPGVARTLRIRLSRFKSNLELQAVVGRPAALAAANPKNTADPKVKPAEGKRQAGDAKPSPAAPAGASR
jgi:hypothetical protein